MRSLPQFLVFARAITLILTSPLTFITVIANITPPALQSSGQDVALTDTDGPVGGVFERVPFG